MKRKLVVADLSNIEGRLLAYLAGEEWKLQAFRDFDAGQGPDLYNVTAVGIVGGDPWTVLKHIRNVFGKVVDLASGYQGGNGAFETFEKTFGVDLLDYWPLIQSTAAPEILDRAYYNWEKWGHQRNPNVPHDLWAARETCKLTWRARHPATVALWYAVTDAAKSALLNPGVTYQAGPHLTVCYSSHAPGEWLLIRLPSGKYLTYFNPVAIEEGAFRCEGMVQTSTGGRVWGDNYMYGGKIIENACQALAGDVLKYNMPSIEQAGYDLLFTVHDEDIASAPDRPEYNAAHLSSLMARVPPWTPGLPLAAAGFESYRYRKD